MTIRSGHDCEPAAFRRVPALRDVSSTSLAALAACCREMRFQAGDRLVPRFHRPRRLLLVAEGLVRMSSVSPNGIERILYLCRPGDLADFRFLLDVEESESEVVAMTPGAALAIDRADFVRVGQDHPELVLAITRALYEQFSRMASSFLGATTAEVPVRVARILLDFAERDSSDGSDYAPLAHPFTHRTLAQIVGASRPHVSAVIGDLEAAGAVRRTNPRGLLVHPGRLRTIVESGEFEPK